MIWRDDVNSLVSQLDGFLAREEVSHRALIKGATAGDEKRCLYWQEITLASLERDVQEIGRRQHRTTTALVKSFASYKLAADELVARTSDAILARLGPQIAVVETAHQNYRGAAEVALARARWLKDIQRFLTWCFAIVTPIAVGIAVLEYESRREQQSAFTSLDLGASTPCEEADWKDKGNLTRSTSIDCRAWEFTAWRSAPGYKLEASVGAVGTEVLRAVARSVGARPLATEMLDGGTEPQPALSYYLCEVPAGAQFRFVAWAPPGIEVRAISIFLSERAPPC